MALRRSRKVPFNCYLSVEQLDVLDLVSERERRPRAELVREAVEIYLARRVDPDRDEARDADDHSSDESVLPDKLGTRDEGGA